MTIAAEGTGVTVEPLSGYIGAEVTGVDLRDELSDDVVAHVRAALHEWKVVFFRDQHLDHAQHVAFARRFGEPVVDDADDAPDGFPEVRPLDSRGTASRAGDLAEVERLFENGWHTDGTWQVAPPSATILRAAVVPPHGGDTTWANLVAAYEGLPEPLRRLADGLWLRHAFPAVGGRWGTDLRETAIHPVVRVHPETGERALYVSPNYTFALNEVVGLSPSHSRRLLDLFYEQVSRPEYTVRFRWRPGSIAFWDNHATAHLGPTEQFQLGYDRVLYRLTLAGPVATSPDGTPSRPGPTIGAAPRP